MSGGQKILIVDDDQRMCDSLRSLLNISGYEVLVVYRGTEAMELLQQQEIDLVLLDLLMPDLDGHQIMDFLNEQDKEIPVIVMTGHASVDSAVASLRRGAYDYLRKPFELEELTNTVSHALDQKRLRRENRTISDQLQRIEERYRYLVDNSPDIVYTLDPEGHFSFINQAVESLLGLHANDLIGRHYSAIVHEDDIAKAEHHFNERRAGERSAVGTEIRLRRDPALGNIPLRDTPYLTAELKAKGIYDDRGVYLGTFGVARDITDRKRMEEELLKGQKLESIGILAGGIAHDFNNILAAIVGNLSLCKLYVKATDKLFELLDDAEKAAFRAKDLTSRLITFAQGGVPIKKRISLSDLVRTACETVLRGSPNRCEVDLPEDLWEVEVDEGQMMQVFNNVIMNADQAMPDGGTIRVKAENVDANGGSGLPLQAGRYLKVSVEDHGPGIAPENMPRIFDPFFTTRANASGLGLASSYSIIRRHGGHIAAESGAGHGTVFHIFLPAPGIAGMRGSPSAEGGMGRKCRILVMDDEEMVRKVVAQMLSHLGCAVDVVADGREAIEKYEEGITSGQPYDMVLLDLTVPGGIGGKETVYRLREIDPSVRALVASGYSDDPVVTRFWEHGFQGVVAKPFRIDELKGILNKVLAGETAD